MDKVEVILTKIIKIMWITLFISAFVVLGIVYYRANASADRADKELYKEQLEVMQETVLILEQEKEALENQVMILNNEVAKIHGRRKESFITQN